MCRLGNVRAALKGDGQGFGYRQYLDGNFAPIAEYLRRQLRGFALVGGYGRLAVSGLSGGFRCLQLAQMMVQPGDRGVPVTPRNI